MKKKMVPNSNFLLVLALFFNYLSLCADPLLVAVLMVKNEESVMAMTLQPLVDAGITDFLIYDTGSIDNTVQVAKSFFEKNKILNFVIEQGAWVDFSTSRNRALQLTEQHFADATFMLMLDAEWILHNGQKLLQMCKTCKNDNAKLYHIRITNDDLDFYHARLIRCNSGIYFVGRVHEVPNISAQGQCDDDIYIQLNITKCGLQKTEERWKKDLQNLWQDFVDNPNSTRTVYYMAQTYFCLSDWDNAIKWYQQRLNMNGDAEEIFMACLCMGHAYACAKQTQKMVLAYLRAYHMRPWRAEPLIRLAEHYFKVKEYALALLFAKASLSMSYPHQEKMPIEKYLYDVVRYEIVSVVAGQCGEFELAKKATLHLLKNNSESEFLQKILKFYETMLENL